MKSHDFTARILEEGLSSIWSRAPPTLQEQSEIEALCAFMRSPCLDVDMGSAFVSVVSRFL